MKNIHILPTDKPSRLHNKNGKLGNYPSTKLYIEDFKGNKHNSFHIYITNDDEIKEGDWKYCANTEQVLKAHKLDKSNVCDKCKKIILTTDVDLIKDGVQAIDKDFLEWFVKNTNCERVEIEKYKELGYAQGIGRTCFYEKYKIVIPKEELSLLEKELDEIQRQLLIKRYNLTNQEGKPFINTMPMISVGEQERIFSEEDLVQLLNFVSKEYNISDGIGWFPKEVLNNWFKQFKKK